MLQRTSHHNMLLKLTFKPFHFLAFTEVKKKSKSKTHACTGRISNLQTERTKQGFEPEPSCCNAMHTLGM